MNKKNILEDSILSNLIFLIVIVYFLGVFITLIPPMLYLILFVITFTVMGVVLVELILIDFFNWRKIK